VDLSKIDAVQPSLEAAMDKIARRLRRCASCPARWRSNELISNRATHEPQMNTKGVENRSEVPKLWSKIIVNHADI
jgi:hypothetical protein